MLGSLLEGRCLAAMSGDLSRARPLGSGCSSATAATSIIVLCRHTACALGHSLIRLSAEHRGDALCGSSSGSETAPAHLCLLHRSVERAAATPARSAGSAPPTSAAYTVAASSVSGSPLKSSQIVKLGARMHAKPLQQPAKLGTQSGSISGVRAEPVGPPVPRAATQIEVQTEV